MGIQMSPSLRWMHTNQMSVSLDNREFTPVFICTIAKSYIPHGMQLSLPLKWCKGCLLSPPILSCIDINGLLNRLLSSKIFWSGWGWRGWSVKFGLECLRKCVLYVDRYTSEIINSDSMEYLAPFTIGQIEEYYICWKYVLLLQLF